MRVDETDVGEVAWAVAVGEVAGFLRASTGAGSGDVIHGGGRRRGDVKGKRRATGKGLPEEETSTAGGGGQRSERIELRDRVERGVMLDQVGWIARGGWTAA